MGERLDKFLASQGLGTRKEVGKLIRSGAVTVDGLSQRDPGAKVDPRKQQVAVEGRSVSYQEHLYIMMNKPAGVLSATEDRHAETVLDLLPEELRRRGLFPAGRLDKDTTGLMLITDDGDLAHRMLSPKKHVYKLYLATLDAPVTEEDVEAFQAGIHWAGESYAPGRLWTKEDPFQGYVEIREGRFHQVKRMFEARGKTVQQLKRLKIGGLALDDTLGEGECRLLTPEEVESIFG
ncbi:MAG: pseudouridine synthase [Acutalibacter sp.]|jgi:16S rRNA pseudouridine516 synthase